MLMLNVVAQHRALSLKVVARLIFVILVWIFFRQTVPMALFQTSFIRAPWEGHRYFLFYLFSFHPSSSLFVDFLAASTYKGGYP